MDLITEAHNIIFIKIKNISSEDLLKEKKG